MRTKQFRVELNEEQRVRLLLLTRQGRTSARTVLRAHILLRASEDAFDDDTAAALHTSVNTVQRVRRRFAEAGLERALYDQPRPGSAPKLDAAGEAQLIALACSKPPEGRTVWTLQLLADKLIELHVIDSISDESVRRTLGKRSAQAVARRPQWCISRVAYGGGARGAMAQLLYGSATTTARLRALIQSSSEPATVLARRRGVDPKPVRKWQRRDSVEDRPMGPHLVVSSAHRASGGASRSKRRG